MFSRYFIDRPIFAFVIGIFICLAGLAAMRSLPVAQYPEIAPPTIRISATYTGASADTVRKTVTQIIEDGMTGLDGLTYMNSSSTTGSASITLTFDNSVNGDIAQVQGILRLCHERRVPVVARGAGTGLSGGALPLEKGVLLVKGAVPGATGYDVIVRPAVKA